MPEIVTELKCWNLQENSLINLGGMYFPKIKRTREQFEFMLMSMLLEYGEQEDVDMAVLLSKNYKITEADALYAIQAYEAMPSEDYEMQSKKIEYAGV